MAAIDAPLKPEECVMLLVDFQAGLGFGVESIPRQLVVNNAVGLARTAVAFKVPVIASTSASRVYSGPLLPALQEALPAVKPIERRSMNVWEGDTARNAVVATNRRRLIIAGGPVASIEVDAKGTHVKFDKPNGASYKRVTGHRHQNQRDHTVGD